MATALTIPETVLALAREQAKNYISQERVHEYLRFLDNSEKVPGRIIIQNECRNVLQSLETLLGSFIGIKEAFLGSNLIPKISDDVLTAVYRTSLLKGTEEGIKSLGINSSNGKSQLSIRIEPGKDIERRISSSLLNEFKRNVLDTAVEKANIEYKTASFYSQLKKGLESGIEENDIYDILDMPIMIDGHKDIPVNIEKIVQPSFLDIGNEEITAFLSDENRLLACYDIAEKKNIALASSRPRVILLTGEPGTGKTELIKQSNYGLAALASKKGIGCNIVIVDNSFWDKYLGESTKRFRSILEQTSDPRSLNRLVLDDCESIVPKRDSDTAGEAGRRVIKELLSFIDNTRYDYYGNFDILLSTNHKFLLDKALSSRVTHEKAVYGPRKPEEYWKAYQSHLEQWNSYIRIDEKEKGYLSDLYAGFGFTGRDICALSQEIIDYIMNISALDEKVFFGGDIRPALEENFRIVKYDLIRNTAVNRHHAKKREEQQVFENRKNIALLNLRVQYQANEEFKEFLKGDKNG